MSGKLAPHLSPDIIGHHNHKKSFHTGANDLWCWRALKPIAYIMGAQITLLRGNASVPHLLLWRNEASLLLSSELHTSPLHSNRLYVYTVCCRRGGQCFTVLRTRHTDVVGDSSGRSNVTEQGHNVPLLRTRGLYTILSAPSLNGLLRGFEKSYHANVKIVLV